MKSNTNVKAGRLSLNHNQTQVRSGLNVKTGVKAGFSDVLVSSY